MAKKNRTNEIKLTRIYDAPVKLVWDAWTDPKKVAKWWGPRGFTLTTHSKDLRDGGSWNYTMHGPDGVDYPNKTFYHKVEKHACLIYDHGANDEQPALFKVTVYFTEMKGNKTKMEMTMALATPEAAEEMERFIKKAGGNATWDRLAEYLDEEATGEDTFVINRSFDAPIELLFDLWTKPEHVSKWLPPTGFSMKYERADIRAGGNSFYSMSGETGIMFYGKAEYLEMTRPSRIVYTQQFCDQNEKISRHPKAPTWPETMITTVEFNEESQDKTRVTITWKIYGKATQEEMNIFHQAKAGMTLGWTGSFDKLEDYLEKQKT